MVSAVASAACGSGGGGGSGGGSSSLSIDSTVLPASLSGNFVDHSIPYSGGAGGPYILERLDGELPEGIELDSEDVAIVGRLLEAGVFDFRLKLTDTGSQPFQTTIAEFHWVVGVGQVVFGTDPDLPDTVFNTFVSFQLVVAGGTPPYSCEVIDDPNNPNDGNLPAGLAIPPSSTSIVGSPQEARPGGAPFYVTILARDHADDPSYPNPGTAVRTFELTVLVPPIVIVSTSLPDGQCGQVYAERIEISDGVPPFKHRLAQDVGSTVLLTGEPGSPGGVAKGSETSAYATDDDVGPAYSKRFPEGIVLVDGTGDLQGVPRRRGSFLDWTYFIQSTLLPDDPTQNQWRNFTFAMTESVPPPMVLDTSVLAAGSNSFAPPNNKIPELESTKLYSLQFSCVNGVPADGNLDAPLLSQQVPDPTEEAGSYKFQADFGVLGVPAGMTFSVGGLFSGTPTQRSGFRSVALTAFDEQLPTSEALGFPNQVSGQFQFSIGPDTVVISETLSGSSATSYDDVAYAFPAQTVEIFEPFSGTPTVRGLQSGDMVADHAHPLPAGTLAGSLTGIDFIHASVNPTWWAYDNLNLNVRGARAAQHADYQRRFHADALHSDFFRRFLGGGGTWPIQGSDHASNSAVELPELLPAVATSPASNPPVNGIYRDGGLLYGYDNTSEFGFFIVRKDGKIEIPVAFAKPGFTGFGDGWVTTSTAASSAIRRPQITVSPDGRFAAAKVKVNVGTFAENAATSKIVLFSLTGEKPFDGAGFKVISTGSGGSSSTGGAYLYGDTLTLTNRHLYYLTGDYDGGVNGSIVIYSRHYVYRYEIAGSATAGALIPAGAIAATAWTNTTSAPLAVPFHKWMSPGVASVASQFSSTGIVPYATSLGTAGPNPHFFSYNYANMSENSMAPHPFRVSANGNACAILAAPDGGTTGAAVSGTNFQRYYLFVDYDTGTGAPIFRQVEPSGRRFGSPTRLGGFAAGEDVPSHYSGLPSGDRLYGWYDGPSPQLEISDDGKRIAGVYNVSSGSWSPSSTYNNDPLDREHLIAYSAAGASGDPWASLSVRDVTSFFSSPYYWRFGCLAFTRDNNGLVFWGGFNSYSGNSGSFAYQYPSYMTGTMYGTDLSGSASVTSLLATTDGGSSAGVTTYSSGSPVSLNGTPAFTGDQGAVSPKGMFVSNDGRFVYLLNWQALTSSEPTTKRLVGVNVSAVSGSTINGRVALRGFAPVFPVTRYGMGTDGYYGGIYGNTSWHRGLGGAQSYVNHQVSAARSGVVFFTGYNSQYGTTWADAAGIYPDNNTYYYPGGVHPHYYGDYGIVGGEVFAFDANVGGNVVKLTNLGSTTQYRPVTYLQPNAEGTKLAVQYAVATPSPYDTRPNQELLTMLSGISSSATGAISTTGTVALESSAGRSSVSVAHDFLGTKLYYGFTTATNENAMTLVEKTLNTSGTAVSNTRTKGGALGGPSGQARFAVLYAGR